MNILNNEIINDLIKNEPTLKDCKFKKNLTYSSRDIAINSTTQKSNENSIIFNVNKNLILILCRKQTEYTNKLNSFFRTNHVDSVLIKDNNDPPQSFLRDEGYHNMTKILDRPSAWEKSLYFIFVNNLYRKILLIKKNYII